jgi:hypothetical protein
MRVATFYSVNESSKPVANQVHHDNNVCEAGKKIPSYDRLSGTGGYRLCKDCKESDDLGH